MAFRIRLGGLTRYPRYVGEVQPLAKTKMGEFPKSHSQGVKSHNATEFEDEFMARQHLDKLLSDKSALSPDDQRALETATVEEV